MVRVARRKPDLIAGTDRVDILKPDRHDRSCGRSCEG
jgi:hypothetical protein